MKTFIIAEAGVNHNGSLENAMQLINIAVAAGADAVKFQTFVPNKVISIHAPKAKYQQETTGSTESQLDMVSKLQLTEDMHIELWNYCKKNNILFLSSPFDEDSADFLIHRLGVSHVKIASGEITNAPLLMRIAQQHTAVILSTGMSTLGDIEKALGVLAFGYLYPNETITEAKMENAFFSSEGQSILQKRVSLLHCTTEYPAPYDAVNLRTMATLQTAFSLPVGLSDHTSGISVAIAAVALGATIIEKHFTLDKTLPGPDHKASLDPWELGNLVTAIRQVELALGENMKIPNQVELCNRVIARKSLVAACAIKKGEIFSPLNITSKRPDIGLSPFKYWVVMGKKADRDYKLDDPIQISE